MSSHIVEKHVGGRTFFITRDKRITEGVHPHELHRRAGIEFYLIAPPSQGFVAPPFGAWRREKWVTVQTDTGIEFAHLDTTLLNDEQVEWIRCNLLA